MLRKLVPFARKQPIQHLALFTVSEDGGSVGLVLVFIFLVVFRILSPVNQRLGVMDDVKVFVEDVIFALQNSDGVDKGVIDVLGIAPGVPQVRNASKKGDTLNEGVAHIVDGKKRSKLDEAVVPHGIENGHTEAHFCAEIPLLLLHKLDGGRNTAPIQSESGQIIDERGKLRSIQIQVGVHIVQIIVIGVMDLIVSHGIAVRHTTIKQTGKKVQNAKISRFPLEEPSLCMTFFVQQHVQVSEQTVSRSQPQRVIHEQCRRFKAVFEVSV